MIAAVVVACLVLFQTSSRSSSDRSNVSCTIKVAHPAAAAAAANVANTDVHFFSVTSPEEALATRRSAAFRAACGAGQTATIELEAGRTFYITDPPLRLVGHQDSDTVWTTSDPPFVRALLSAGTLLQDTCWTSPQTGSRSGTKKWRCQIGARRGFRSITVGGRLARPARFPDYDAAHPFTGGWLFVNSSRYAGNGTYVIGVEDAMLPAFAQLPGWLGATVSIFPTRSWINLVQVSITPVADRADTGSTAGIRYFVLACPPPANLCVNTSNSASIGPGNRFFIEGDASALSVPGEWHHDQATQELVVSTDGPPPKAVVIPGATAVVEMAAPPVPVPLDCKFTAVVAGISPGSAIATLPSKNMSFGDCTAACCALQGCLAVNFNPVNCYLLDRTYEGNFHPGGSQLADRVLPPPLPPHQGPNNVVFEAIGFADTDYSFFGYQEGWSETVGAAGMPRDAALVISESADIVVTGCSFRELAGGGIHITKKKTKKNQQLLERPRGRLALRGARSDRRGDQRHHWHPARQPVGRW